MTVQVNENYLHQANFPKCFSGRLSDVYYTIYKDDGTIYQVRNQVGVVELGEGSYGVKKSFTEIGNYSIFWEIGDKEFVASEEVNVSLLRLIQPIAIFG